MLREISTVVPPAVLGWHEEETRIAFARGQAAFLRNWPYAARLLADPNASSVAGRFAVAPLPGSRMGEPVATLGGSLLAVNARSDRPRLARELVRFLTSPAAMRERAREAGQIPARRSVLADPSLAGALPAAADVLARAIENATARPATPVYAELSGILQAELHRALSRQVQPAQALADAAARMREVLRRSGLAQADLPSGGRPR